MKSCFVICPIGRPGTDTRKRADQLLTRIITPVTLRLGYAKPLRADLSTEHQRTIPDDISRRLFDAHLVIADLSDGNPNVFYELGKRHAWGRRCIHLSQDVGTLPFDVKHYRTIPYSMVSPDDIDEVRQALESAIRNVERSSPPRPLPLTPNDVIALTGATVLVERVDGRRNHYKLAEQIASARCVRMFLLQRSSSFVLGPESGWGEEATFYSTVKKKIREGSEFFHIVSLEGLRWHLGRKDSMFPSAKRTLGGLARNGQIVGIRGPKKFFGFKQLPDLKTERDMKPDRQARTFLVEYADGRAEGVLVVDLGGQQSAFHLRGPEMTAFLRDCMEFYSRCPFLSGGDLEPIITSLKSRGEWSDQRKKARGKVAPPDE